MLHRAPDCSGQGMFERLGPALGPIPSPRLCERMRSMDPCVANGFQRPGAFPKGLTNLFKACSPFRAAYFVLRLETNFKLPDLVARRLGSVWDAIVGRHGAWAREARWDRLHRHTAFGKFRCPRTCNSSSSLSPSLLLLLLVQQRKRIVAVLFLCYVATGRPGFQPLQSRLLGH